MVQVLDKARGICTDGDDAAAVGKNGPDKRARPGVAGKFQHIGAIAVDAIGDVKQQTNQQRSGAPYHQLPGMYFLGPERHAGPDHRQK